MEFEKKILLTEEEYQAVLKQRSREGRRHRREHYVQKNHYYDTEDLSMNRQGITCRIREKKGRFTATHKTHTSGHSIEKSAAVTGVSDLFPLASTPLKRKGCLLTERHKWSLDNGIVVCLDKNTYLEAVDYELEIEYPQGQDELAYLEIQAVTGDLCSAGLMHSAGEIVGRLLWAKSKSQRFFDRYRKRQGLPEIGGDRL